MFQKIWHTKYKLLHNFVIFLTKYEQQSRWRHCCINVLAHNLRWRLFQIAYAALRVIFEQTEASVTVRHNTERI